MAQQTKVTDRAVQKLICESNTILFPVLGFHDALADTGMAARQVRQQCESEQVTPGY